MLKSVYCQTHLPISLAVNHLTFCCCCCWSIHKHCGGGHWWGSCALIHSFIMVSPGLQIPLYLFKYLGCACLSLQEYSSVSRSILALLVVDYMFSLHAKCDTNVNESYPVHAKIERVPISDVQCHLRHRSEIKHEDAWRRTLFAV